MIFSLLWQADGFRKIAQGMFRFSFSADKTAHTTRAVFSRQRYVKLNGFFLLPDDPCQKVRTARLYPDKV